MTIAAEAHHMRFRRVLEHIDEHLDDALTVDRLSAVAAFSKFHFHRQFSALFGLGVYRYVQLMRLRRASHQLAYRQHLSIIEIALTSGYDSHEAFSRAFKKVVGQTPSEFRQQPQWEAWHAVYQPLTQVRTLHMKPDLNADQVKLVVFPETKVAVREHRGDPRAIGDSIREVIAWRKQNHLGPSVSATFNILYDNPSDTPPEDFRLDICVATDRPIAENPYGMVAKTIPGGRCAVLRHVGSEDKLFQAVGYLYATWLPSSGEEPRDFPLFLQRVSFVDVPEHEAVVDIFLPLK